MAHALWQADQADSPAVGPVAQDVGRHRVRLTPVSSHVACDRPPWPTYNKTQSRRHVSKVTLSTSRSRWRHIFSRTSAFTHTSRLCRFYRFQQDRDWSDDITDDPEICLSITALLRLTVTDVTTHQLLTAAISTQRHGSDDIGALSIHRQTKTDDVNRVYCGW